MKWILVKTDHIYQGLPARDLDDSELSPAQVALLEDAVTQGVYQPAHATAKPPKPPVKSSQGETNDHETKAAGD
jgi:hypothetical protein